MDPGSLKMWSQYKEIEQVKETMTEMMKSKVKGKKDRK